MASWGHSDDFLEGLASCWAGRVLSEPPERAEGAPEVRERTPAQEKMLWLVHHPEDGGPRQSMLGSGAPGSSRCRWVAWRLPFSQNPHTSPCPAGLSTPRDWTGCGLPVLRVAAQALGGTPCPSESSCCLIATAPGPPLSSSDAAWAPTPEALPPLPSPAEPAFRSPLLRDEGCPSSSDGHTKAQRGDPNLCSATASKPPARAPRSGWELPKRVAHGSGAHKADPDAV